MPKCQSCGSSVRSSSLKKVGAAVVCPDCGKPKAVEGKMAEDKKKVASVVLQEIPTSDGAVDHEVIIEGSYGGLEIKFDTTFDKIRDFFTRRREEAQ